ncbi:MAG: PAS domain-containing protein [Hyphomicrobiales bacterium]|nr:PAS domain-containing protein [Hyphomicrobiales bacterium]
MSALGRGAEGLAGTAAAFGALAATAGAAALAATWGRDVPFEARVAAGAAVCAIVLAIAVGLSERRRARATERRARGLFGRVERALSCGRCGLWDWDVARGRLYWSASMYELLGMEPDGDHVSAARFAELLHPEDADPATLLAAATASFGEPIEANLRMRAADGGWRALRARLEATRDGDGAPRRIVGIVVDVGVELRLERERARADMRLREAVEGVDQPFALWDADGGLVLANATYHGLCGDPTADPVAIYATLAERAADRAEPGPDGARQFVARAPDGRWLQFSEKPTREGGHVFFGADITALKRHETELEESRRRLVASVGDAERARRLLERQAQQLAELAELHLEQKSAAEAANRAKSEFLDHIGHELRTPLNAIVGFSEMMRLETLGPLGARRYLDYCAHIHESGLRLSQFVEDVLEFTTLDSGRARLDLRSFALDAAWEKVARDIGPVARAKGVAVEFGGGATALRADPRAVERILESVVGNAVKFTPEGGTVRARAEAHEGEVVFVVEDNGCGIAAERLEGLGRPFEHAGAALENGTRGFGLGLAIARALTELHGGELRVASRRGAGARVSISLPQAARAAAH